MAGSAKKPAKPGPQSPPVFDPDGPASAAAGIFGLPFTPQQSRVIVVPVPFEATTSYGGGTAKGPRAILAASKQVDLYDLDIGTPYESGIAMLPIPRKIEQLNREAKKDAAEIIAVGGDHRSDPKLLAALDRVNSAGDRLNSWVYQTVSELLDAGRIVATLGGDHSVPFGAIQAHAERNPGLGILHLDAHADLRRAYEGFTWSHASIFYNVMTRIPQVGKLVQVGVRDLGSAEKKMIDDSGGRIVTFFDSDLSDRRDRGVPYSDIADQIVGELPEQVYLSWDIDGLDPTLCPGTGTPVPGGLSWHEAMGILRALLRAGKRIVGLDLCEVAPGNTEWDANVGSRLLYKMIGVALKSQG